MALNNLIHLNLWIKFQNVDFITMEDFIMKKRLFVLLSTVLFAMILNGCSNISPSDNTQEEKLLVLEQKTKGSELPETTESSNSENEISNMEEIDYSFSYYGTWEVRDYQSAEISALSSDDMASYREVKIAYQSDSILLDGENMTADDNFTYETDDAAYNYDSLMEAYKANLGEWWNNISEVTCVTIDSNEFFFGNQFFVVDSDTIWIYYEGVFFLAKKL